MTSPTGSPRRLPPSNPSRRRPRRHPCRRERATADQLIRKTSLRLPAPGNLSRLMTLRRYRGSARADLPITSSDGLTAPSSALQPRMPTSPPASVPTGEGNSRPTRPKDQSPSAGSWEPIPDHDPSPVSRLSPSRHPHRHPCRRGRPPTDTSLVQPIGVIET